MILRAKDKEHEIERALVALRGQTVPVEIIVVDSGSTDRTREVARAHDATLIEIPPEDFTYGYALNVGAEAAGAPIHFALSAHCYPEREDWVERSLSHYARPDVAGTGGYGPPEPGDPVIHQDLALLEADPFQGLSSHAGSWRADLWRRFPYDESMESAEDREWSWRVLKEGWVIALDPALRVATRHRKAYGVRHWYRISRRDVRAVATFMSLPRYTNRELVRDWRHVGRRRRRTGLRALASPWRMASLLAKRDGTRDAARVRSGARPPWSPPGRRPGSAPS